MKNCLFLMSVLAAGLAFSANDSGYSISRISAIQRWPWDNKVDIRFWLDLGAEKNAIWYGAEVDVAVTVGGVTTPIAASSLDKTTVCGEGFHTLVWTPTAEFTSRVLEGASFAVTIRRAPVKAAYLTVDLTTGRRECFGPEFAVAVTNGTVYKSKKMAFRRCPATTSDEWKAISGGKDYFVMGTSDPNDEVMKPRNAAAVNVRLTKDFWLGVFPVTWGQWKALGFEKSKEAHGSSYSGNDYYIAMGIAYAQTRGEDNGMYCFPASRAVDPDSYMGRLRTLAGGLPFDLPTEAQMEYAIRAGTTSKWYWGENVKGTLPMGSWAVGLGSRGVPPNAWGFYDISDAAEQWTTTLGKDANDAYYPHVAGDDPEGETPTWSPRKRVTRGTNCYAGNAAYAQAAYRYPQTSFGGTAAELRFTGFRVCLVLPDEPSALGK